MCWIRVVFQPKSSSRNATGKGDELKLHGLEDKRKLSTNITREYNFRLLAFIYTLKLDWNIGLLESVFENCLVLNKDKTIENLKSSNDKMT